VSAPHTPELGHSLGDSGRVYPDAVRPPDAAPNVVVIVLDDLGFGQLGCFGSDIETPVIDGLAADGLRYNRFHVTALCSPTRASLFTGRNHHAVGMGFLVDVPLAFPGYNGRIPPSAAPLPRLLRDAGYNTMAVGKWHLVPRGERSPAGPYARWPLGYGFERYYGFLQGDTNHWAPNLVEDNHYIDAPRTPEEGYHLTEDLADVAVRMVVDQQRAAPGKPFFLYFALGAMHAPHQVHADWITHYAGRFDQGWDEWRTEVFRRQLDSGVVPDGTVLTERPSWVSGWDDLDAGARAMHARAMEVYAGFLSHTDAQIGRVLAALDRIGQRDNTVVMLLSDNGASAEGGRHGTTNEHRFSAQLPETVEGNLAHLEDWGGPRSYNHYSWGWAWAGNTPFRLWKRYAWLGGTRTPLIVRWPERIRDGDGVRDQFCHAVDLMPTILETCGLEPPQVVDGITQQSVDGASFAATFTDPEAAAARDTQYFEMLGSRSIVSGSWKATTDHVSQGVLDEEQLMEGSRDFATDHWALFDLATDFSESTDVSAAHPDVVDRLAERWLIEAGRNNVMPMSEGLVNRLGAIIFPDYPPGNRAVFTQDGEVVCDETVPLLFGGFELSVSAYVPAEPAGVLVALGDWNGGYAMYVVDGRLRFTFAPAGDPVDVIAPESLPEGQHRLSVSFAPTPGGGGEFHLGCDGERIASARMEGAIPLALQHGGTRLRIGKDVGLPVSDAYSPPFPWTGTIEEVVVETPGPAAGTGGLPSVRDVEVSLHAD